MSESTPQEILEARKKMAEKFGNLQIGGKGTQRRKKEAKVRGNKVEADKKIQAIAKKSGARKLGEVSEINIFKDDNNVVHIKNQHLNIHLKKRLALFLVLLKPNLLKNYFLASLNNLDLNNSVS